MSRKILIDGTPGVDMAMALSIAMFHPELELMAATSIGGRLPEGTAARNLHGLVEFLDPPKFPRIGVGTGPSPEMRDLWRRSDFLENAGLPDIERLAPCSADRIIIETVRAAPREVTVVTCGPLTNLLRAIQRDPELPSLLRRIVIAGGTVTAPGDVTPTAEFNIFADPLAAAEIFHSPVTKQLVPLDVTSQMGLSYASFFEQCPREDSRIGRLLRRILPATLQECRDQDGRECMYCPGTIAMMTVLAPHLFQVRLMNGDVEVNDGLCLGTTVFDRREPPRWPGNIDVVLGATRHETSGSHEPGPALQLLYESLEQAARETLDTWTD